MGTSQARFDRPWAGQPPLRAMFVLCSEDYFSAGLIAQCNACIVLQTPWGAAAASEAQARATLEYAVLHEGVRYVVILAHRGCRSIDRALSQACEQAFAQWQWLTNDEFSRSLFHDHGVRVHLLWVDASAGEVWNWRADQQRLEPVGRGGFGRLLARLEEPTS